MSSLTTSSTLALTAILLLLTLALGIWLSIRGKPYNGILFNAHKLIALGMVILTAMRLYNAFKVALPPTPIIIMIIVIGVCIVALFASGGFMSAGVLSSRAMLTVHRIALGLGFLTLGLAVYLVGTGGV
jgi:hypothetical protein